MKGKRYPSTPISHFPGIGPYALDSYRIFCDSYNNPASEEWKDVMPTDKELIRFLVSISLLIVLKPFAQERDVATEMEMGIHRAQGMET